MAYEVPGFVYSYMSTGDIAQYHAVVIGAAGAITDAANAALRIDGVAQMPAAAAAPETIRIMKDGITFGIAGDAVTQGDEVEVDAAGRFILLAGGVAVGKALTTTGAADELLCVLLY